LLCASRCQKKLFKTELTIDYYSGFLPVLNDFELIIYGLIGTGVFAFGAGDLKDILKAVAKARTTLTQVSKESTQLLTQAALTAPEPNNKTASEPASKDLMLLKMANTLGIITLGKTREQLTEEINAKVRKLSS
jgi:hypothetical protein